MDDKAKLLLVGVQGEEHIGTHLRHAADGVGLPTLFCDMAGASGERTWLNRVRWRMNGHRPARMRQFGEQVVQACRESGARRLLATGLAPLEEEVLREIGRLGIDRINYLTDDPWNKAHRAPWFLRALKQYDRVFSTRRAALEDLRGIGCRDARFLPFAYAPGIHHPATLTEQEKRDFSSDLLFVGGADRDRVPLVRFLILRGFPVALYGSGWERHAEMRPYYKGYATAEIFRKAVAGAKINLCLVRKANRDGNSMRSFEIPAMKGCVLAEETEEHLQILGKEGEAARYFRTPERMVEAARELLENEGERNRLASEAHRRITLGGNTYLDRLKTMLEGRP